MTLDYVLRVLGLGTGLLVLVVATTVVFIGWFVALMALLSGETGHRIPLAIVVFAPLAVILGVAAVGPPR